MLHWGVGVGGGAAGTGKWGGGEGVKTHNPPPTPLAVRAVGIFERPAYIARMGVGEILQKNIRKSYKTVFWAYMC